MVINSILNCIKSWINCNNAVLNCSKSRLNCNKSAQIFSDIYFKCQCATPIGSGPRYQILSHVFARCASQKTYCHARFACYSRMVVGFLTCSMCEKCDISYTSGHCLRYIIFIGELAIMFSNTKSVVTQHCSLSLFSTVAIQWMNVAIYKPFIVVTGTGHHNLGDSSYGCVCQ